MGRKELPPEQRLDDTRTIKMRGTAAQGQLWRETAAELGMLPTEFARASVASLIMQLAKHDEAMLARAIKRANRVLCEQGLEPISIASLLDELSTGPAHEVISWSHDDFHER